MPINFKPLATGALGFTLALAWTDGISKSIKAIYPRQDTPGASAKAALLYAAFVTAIIYLIVVFSGWWNLHGVSVKNHEENLKVNHETDPTKPPTPYTPSGYIPYTKPVVEM